MLNHVEQPKQLAKTGIAFVCSLNYLLFTLVAARQAKRFAPPQTPITIILDEVEKSDGWIASLSALVGIEVKRAPLDILHDLDSVPHHHDFFEHSHLNRASLLRLRIADLVSSDIERILYLDGDIQIRDSLQGLLEMPTPAGKILVVRDWKAHQTHEGMPEAETERRALAKLGLPEAAWPRYFNSGVMLTDRSTWREIGRDALHYYRTYPERCPTLDQCALNAVAHDKTVLISPRWNFLRAYMNLTAYRDLNPAIVHFAAPPKPWDGPMEPWGHPYFKPYSEMAKLLWEYDLPWRRMPIWRRTKWTIRMARNVEFTDIAYRHKLERLLRQDEATESPGTNRQPTW